MRDTDSKHATWAPFGTENPEAMTPRYVIVTPVRDEAKYLASTIESVAAQVVLPTEWVIVDDGSSDSTPLIIEKSLNQYSWIRSVCRPNRGFRYSGAGVMDAFYDGYERLQTSNWDFLVKLDGDLSFTADYFSSIFKRFCEQPTLGIAGGSVYHVVGGRRQLEKCPRFHVRGATKVYRRACWEAIGGLQRVPGWDIIDEAKANQLGWTTESFSDLHLIHHRFTGSAESTWRNMVKNGKAYYVAGYHPLFMTAKCLYRLTTRPHFAGPLGMAYGFLSSYLQRSPQVNDRALIEYVRREQLRRLCGLETIWK